METVIYTGPKCGGLLALAHVITYRLTFLYRPNSKLRTRADDKLRWFVWQ